MQQPQGYEQSGSGVVWHLKRTLRQTPRAWHLRLKEDLGSLGFEAPRADGALFSGIVDGERVYLVVWVDDIVIAAPGTERAAKVKAHLAEKFDVRDRGEATYCCLRQTWHPSSKRNERFLIAKFRFPFLSFERYPREA